MAAAISPTGPLTPPTLEVLRGRPRRGRSRRHPHPRRAYARVSSPTRRSCSVPPGRPWPSATRPSIARRSCPVWCLRASASPTIPGLTDRARQPTSVSDPHVVRRFLTPEVADLASCSCSAMVVLMVSLGLWQLRPPRRAASDLQRRMFERPRSRAEPVPSSKTGSTVPSRLDHTPGAGEGRPI